MNNLVANHTKLSGRNVNAKGGLARLRVKKALFARARAGQTKK